MRGSLDLTEERLVHHDCIHVTEHMEEWTQKRLEFFDLFLVKKDWAKALSLIESILDPSDPTDWYNKGNVLRNLGHNEDAVESFSEAIFLDTHYVKAWYRKGQAMADMAMPLGSSKSLQDAARCFENVLVLERWLNEACELAENKGSLVLITNAVKEELAGGVGLPGSMSSVSLIRAPPLGLLEKQNSPGKTSWSQAALLYQVWALMMDANSRTLKARESKTPDIQPSPDEHQRILKKLAYTYFTLQAYHDFASRLPRLTGNDAPQAAMDLLGRAVPDLIMPNLGEILDVVQPKEAARIIGPGDRH